MVAVVRIKSMVSARLSIMIVDGCYIIGRESRCFDIISSVSIIFVQMIIYEHIVRDVSIAIVPTPTCDDVSASACWMAAGWSWRELE